MIHFKHSCIRSLTAFDSPNNRINSLELNDVNILLKLVKQSGMITILSETTIYNEEGFKSIPIDLRIREMEGCIHIKKNVYQKRSSKEFIRLLGESNAVRERMQECMK